MVLDAKTFRERLLNTPLVSPGNGWYRAAFKAMGTDCRIDFAAPSQARARRFARDALAWLAEFEIKYSRYRPDSLITRINRAAGKEPVAIDAELESIFRLCDWFHWQTLGLFDPTMLPLLLLWDYQAECPRIPADHEIEAAREKVGWPRVVREPGTVFLPVEGMALDLGGIGKEYAVDRVLEMALRAGLENVLINFGQDIRMQGAPPEGGAWRIGLEHPLQPGSCWGGVQIQNRAVATSGDYLRFFERGGRRFGHLLDPRTGRPADNGTRSVSVLAPTCTEAGILSSTAFLLGPEEGLQLIERFSQAAGCIWTAQSLIQSRRFESYVLSEQVV